MNDVLPRGPLSVTSAEVCDRGKVREENQDNVRSATVPLGRLFVVADGIGGYQGGATASRMVVEGFASQLAARPANYPPDRALQEACDFTNASIHAAAASSDPSLQRMGSTVVLALVQTLANGSPIAWVGHVGDSRAYLVRAGKMTKITNDHSAVQALINRNLITEEEARNHPDASVLTRSLGHRPEVEIEIDRVDLQSGDALLLCSDGLWGYVLDSDIATVATDTSLSVQTTAETLLHQALAAGGQDNIGIEFIRIGTASPALASPAIKPHDHAAEKGRRNQMWLAIGLLLLGGCGGLGYLAYSQNWFSKFGGLTPKDPVHKAEIPPGPQRVPGPTPSEPHSTHAGGQDKHTPAPKNQASGQIGVVGDIPESVEDHKPPPNSRVWRHVSIKRSEQPACFDLARPGVTEVYSEVGVDINEALDQHPELRPHVPNGGIETHKMEPRIKAACGDFEVVVVLPKKAGGIPPAREAPESAKPTEQQSHPNQQPSQDPQAEMLPPARPEQSPARLPEPG